MITLSEKLKYVLLEGPKVFGTYRYPDALGGMDESLSLSEHETAESFLTWVVENEYTYGYGNLNTLFEEWKKGREIF